MGSILPTDLPVRSETHHISLDVITGLTVSEGIIVIMTVVDHFSKMAHFIPLAKLPSAEQTAELMIHGVFQLHGFPTDNVSDRGPQFRACFWK